MAEVSAEKLRQVWQNNPDLQKEFPTFGGKGISGDWTIYDWAQRYPDDFLGRAQALNPSATSPYTNYTNQNGTIVNTQTGKQYSTPEELSQDLGITPDKIDWYQIQMNGATGTPSTPGVSGSGLPDEFQKYVDEAQQYYGYTLPTGQASAYYPTQLSELDRDISTQKQRLLEDYNQYMEDLNTGKIRAGTDYQQQIARGLEQRAEFLQQQEFTIKNDMESLNRDWISRGGLFSGARVEAGQNYMQGKSLEQGQYMSNLAYNQKQTQTNYERQLEDYASKQKSGQTAYDRGSEDIALQKIKDLRSLNEKYETAIANKAGQSGYFDWRKLNYGY